MIHNVFCGFCRQKLNDSCKIPICICIFGRVVLFVICNFFPVYPGF